MKIGILTFHRSINNGAFMQAYALSNEIRKKFGNIVEIVDFELETKHNSYKKRSLNKFVVYGGKYGGKYKKFQEDLSLLPLSPKTLITNDYEEVRRYIESRYDIVIVGSDAIWAYTKGLGLENPFWLYGDKLDVIKMSYAASAFSLDIKSIHQNDRDYIKNCLSSFSYIGVRDDETRKFVQSLDPNFNIYRNCDPTVLLEKPSKDDGYKVLKKYGVKSDKKLVGIMLSGNDYIPQIKKLLGKKEYKFIDIHRKNYSSRKPYLSFNKSLFNLSPYEWHQIYSQLYMNFTNFFHGTLLGLKSDVPTFSFDTVRSKAGSLSKINQILTDLDLSDYWIDRKPYSKEEEDRILSQVEYTVKNHDFIRDKIDKNMHIERKRSESFFEHLGYLL